MFKISANRFGEGIGFRCCTGLARLIFSEDLPGIIESFTYRVAYGAWGEQGNHSVRSQGVIGGSYSATAASEESEFEQAVVILCGMNGATRGKDHGRW